MPVTQLERFLNSWPKEKPVLQAEMRANKLWNAEFRSKNKLSTKDKEYKQGRKFIQISKNQTASKLLEEVPNEIFSRAALLKNEYKIKASVGNGEIAEIPWICLFDKDITLSAQSGYYIVYLFRTDLSGFYLSLNQGWTQYEKMFKPKSQAKFEIEKTAHKLRKTLKTVAGFSFDPIDLKGGSDLAKGYELGNICSIYYDANNLPSTNVFINDLQKLIGSYRELKSLIGTNVLDINFILDEEEFQERAQSGKVKILKKGKVPKKKKTNGSTSYTWPRDPDLGFTAISNAGFKCENNQSHKTFKSAVTTEQFVEAHHLIPMKFQGEFDDSIDVPENIISLCPNCHRAFHNAIIEIKTALIKKFFHERKALLLERGIKVDESEILKYYNLL